MTPSRKTHIRQQSKAHSTLKKIYTRFLKIRGEPREIALGFALGLFIGMTPIMGFHIVIAIFLAGLLKWNKISAALAVWISNPITAPFIYGTTYLLGVRVMGINKAQALSESVYSTTFLSILKKTPEVFGAMTVGGAILGLPLALIGFYFAYTAITKYQEDIKRKLAEQKNRHTLKKELRKRKKRKEQSMKEQLNYKCRICERTIKLTSDEKIPECCDAPMEQAELPPCTLSETAEHARHDEISEPCDDGRSGKI